MNLLDKDNNKTVELLMKIEQFDLSTMRRAFNEDGPLMYERYANKFEMNMVAFYNDLCDIDRWKFDRFIDTHYND